MRLLSEHGANLNAKVLQTTALHRAAAAGDEAILATLLELGASPNERDGRGKTPREVAEAKGNAACMRLLLLAEAGQLRSLGSKKKAADVSPQPIIVPLPIE